MSAIWLVVLKYEWTFIAILKCRSCKCPNVVVRMEKTLSNEADDGWSSIMLKLCYKLGHYASIMLDALTMPLLCPTLCRCNVSNPTPLGKQNIKINS